VLSTSKTSSKTSSDFEKPVPAPDALANKHFVVSKLYLSLKQTDNRRCNELTSECIAVSVASCVLLARNDRVRAETTRA
jgi:hypothetical protein